MVGGMGMELKDGLIERLRVAPGKVLPPAPDSPSLERFNPQQLAAAIEHEVGRANICGYTKMSIHMDIVDAVALMNHLRK